MTTSLFFISLLSLSPPPLTTPLTILPPTPHPPLLRSNKSVKPLASLTNACAPYPNPNDSLQTQLLSSSSTHQSLSPLTISVKLNQW